jgi:pSer/pThr/pTyr-binding forkhead associated (FHA) protein
MIEDLNSANGTLMNGNRIKSADLEPGDVMQLGSVILHFRLTPDDAPDDHEDDEDTGTFPQLTIPNVEDQQNISSSDNNDSGGRNSGGRFVSRINRSRRKRG